jgi:hypothetical protein
MGRITTPKYRFEMAPIRAVNTNLPSYSITPSAWKVKEHGKPTTDNIDKYVRAFIDSTKLGGCNDHFSKDAGYIPVPNYARIVRQADNQVMAEWRAPMFMAI